MWYKKGYVQFIVLGVFLLFMYFLLINRTQDNSFLAFKIEGSGSSIFIRDVVIINTKTPIIDLFSAKNPIGNYIIDLKILDKNRNVILFGNLTNLGVGQSIFKLGSYLEGDYIIQVNGYYNNKMVLPPIEYSIDIPENINASGMKVEIGKLRKRLNL